ncbi:MAG TPA: DinB family protein [Fluviicola sp.]|nr:DinB family protein [Fluviicola sp.]
MESKWVFNEIATITERNIQLLKSTFSKYSEVQLNWKPNAVTWSINEIFAHLNAYSAFYNHKFHEKIDATKFRKPKDQFTPSPLGKSAWVSMKLGNARNVKRKFKAPKDYNPTLSPELVHADELQRRIAAEVDFLSIIEKSVAVSLKRVKIPLSMSRLVKLRLGDALLFVAYHADRHMEQALAISKSPKFPKK